MATVSPVANWYVDPSGRHAGRFWDGYTWTAHVFDEGVAGIDPPTTPSAAPPTAPESTAGHGTRQLQAMATQASITASASALATKAPASDTPVGRRTLFGMTIPSIIGLAVLAVVAAVAISATGILQPGSGSPPVIATTVDIAGDGFTAAVPLGWAQAAAPPGSPFDAFYTAPGLEVAVGLGVGVGDVALTEAQVADRSARAQMLDFVAETVASTFGRVVQVTGRGSRTIGGRSIDVISVEVTYPDGGTGHVAEYLVVGPNRAVVIAASGSERAVSERRNQLTGTARSVRFHTSG